MAESKSFARKVFPRYAPLLGKRAELFSRIFEHLESNWVAKEHKDPPKSHEMTLIEVGSAFEVFLDAFANFWGGRAIVVDSSRGEGLSKGPNTKLMKGDS